MRIRNSLLTFLIIIAMLLQPAAVLADRDSAGSEVTGWFFYKKNSDVTVMLVDDAANSGTNSLHITNRTPANGDANYFRIHSEVSLPTAGKYKFGCYAKTNNAGRATMFFKSSMPSIVPFTKTRDWQRFEFVYDCTAPMSDWLGFMIFDKCDDIWIDDVFMYLLDENGNPTGENLIKNPSFEADKAKGKSAEADISGYYYYEDDLTAMNGFLSRAKNIPVMFKDGLSVDADASDWAGIEPIHMSGLNYITKDAVSADAQIRYAYDSEKFYFLIEVEDDIHFDGADYYWRSDSIQVMLSSKPAVFGTEVGIMHKSDGGLFSTHMDIDIKTARVENTTVYEIGVPWGSYIPNQPSPFSFNCIVNDNDGEGRYTLEIAPGMSAYKGAGESPVLEFMPEGQTSYEIISGNTSATAGKTEIYEIDILNWGDSRSFSVEIPDMGVKKTVTVNKNGVGQVKFAKTPEEVGFVGIHAIVDEKEITLETMVNPDEATFNEYVDGFNADIAQIRTLIEKCTEKGISTDYEKAYLAHAQRSIEVMQSKFRDGDLEIIAYNLNAVGDIMEECKDNLHGYLSGAKKEKITTKYITDKFINKGKSFYAMTETDGVLEERPVSFMGFNKGWENRDERSEWKDFGMNFTSEGPAFSDVIGDPGWPDDWSINPAGNGYADADITVEAGEGIDGSNALKIVNRSSSQTDGNASYLWQYIKIKPNTTYHYGYKVKGKNISGLQLAIEAFRKAEGTFDEWTSFDYKFTTNDNPNYPIFMLKFSESLEGAYVDDVYLHEGDSKVNMLSNGGFESYYEPLEGTEFGINRSVIEELKKNIQRNEYNNTAFYLTLTLHSTPSIIRKHPSYQAASGFLNYGVENDYIIDSIRVFLEQLLPVVEDYSGRVILMLANEPAVSASSYEFYVPSWQKYLFEKYGTIDNLNSYYGSSYAAFEEVKMPTAISDDLLYYDYRVFNESLMEGYFEKLYKIVKEINPEILVTNKFMIDLCSTENNSYGTPGISRGMNFDNLHKSSDIAGNDAWAYLGNTSCTMEAKMMWYDYQSDVAQTPVMNMEDHIIFDSRDMDFAEELPQWYYSSLWQGIIHGLGADTAWLWGRSDSVESGAFNNTTVQYRADCMKLSAQVALDANRLGREIAAIKDRKADVALLYSHPSRSYETFYMNSLYNAYRACMYNGVKPFFLIENQIEKLGEYDMLIVPEAIHVTDKVFNAVLDFARNGGKVVMIGENCLTYNQNNQPFAKELVSEIKKNAQILPANSQKGLYVSAAEADTEAFLSGIFTAENKIKVVLKDSQTGEVLHDTECMWAEYDGGYVLNICNYDWNSGRTAVIEIDRVKAENMVDLITLEEVGDTVELKPYSPVMVYIK
ncbi:MAG: beta-galactosidase [Clostridia bacterium]|nr:beta-galactosidase [Clostridia bacterium]MBP3360083.1 beta-galactosidase [Clostridia bacterium]